MRKRLVLTVLLLAVLVGLVRLILAPREREPVYQGKPLSYWLQEINRAGSMEKAAPALNAIRTIGTNSLPFMLRHIQHKESPIKKNLAALSQKQSLIKLPFLEPNPLVSPSLLAVRQLAADAKPLIPELVELLDGGANSWRGEMGLWAIGPEARFALETACHRTNELVRAKAGLVLARMSIGGVGTVGDGWSWGWYRSPVSGRMRFGLGSVVTEDVLEALRRSLQHRDAAVRRASADALKRLGNQAKPAVSALSVALSDEEPVVREAAAQALKAIDPNAAAKTGLK